ncbi:MAG: APC family permease, partial [Acidimicrobiales bacterium]|nr:APC family permease [Acidimicrobiales bacterium]
TYLNAALGPQVGFVAGIALFGAYICVLVFTFAFYGGFISSFAATYGVHAPWQIWTAGLGLIVTGVGVLGLRPSIRVALLGLILETAIFAALTLVILSEGGAHGLSVQPFSPARSATGTSGVFLGSVYTIFAFVGFESATTLGEEARSPKRTIPRAVMLTTLAIGIFYVFVTYAEVIGFGLNRAGLHELQTNLSPFTSLANRYIGGWMGPVVAAATISSLTALCIAQITAGSRVLFALGRDRMAPRWLGHASHKGVPALSILAISTVGVGAGLIGGSAWGAVSFASWSSFLGTLFFIGAYALLAVGVTFFARKRSGMSFHPVRHAAIPLLGFAGIMLVLYGNVHPLPPSPLRYLIWSAIAIAALATAFVVRLSQRDPERVRAAGRILGTGEARDPV